MNITIVCPICGCDVKLTSHAEAVGVKPDQVAPSFRGGPMTEPFIAPHWVTRWDPRYKIMCPMSNAKVKPV